MTDFIDVLEQQLLAAHRRPERRRFVAVPWRTTIVFAGAVAAAAVVVLAVLALASPSPQPAGSGPPTQPPQTTPVHPPAPSPIAVINGTDVSGLAVSTAESLTNYGYRDVFVVTNDAGGPPTSESGVSYEPGHHDLAQSVAACLEIRPDRVRPMTAHTRSVAGNADVAVLLGADRVP